MNHVIFVLNVIQSMQNTKKRSIAKSSMVDKWMKNNRSSNDDAVSWNDCSSEGIAYYSFESYNHKEVEVAEITREDLPWKIKRKRTDRDNA